LALAVSEESGNTKGRAEGTPHAWRSGHGVDRDRGGEWPLPIANCIASCNIVFPVKGTATHSMLQLAPSICYTHQLMSTEAHRLSGTYYSENTYYTQ
jgi:hypothetical protein